MKALFGVVSLLVALAIVGLLAVKQFKVVGHAGSSPVAGGSDMVAVPQLSGSGTVPQQARQLEQRVVDDVAKAMKQGAESRNADGEKP